jgi:AcrR family transcriptional regulator
VTDSATQERIVKAALEVFASKGYEGASTREICRLAGVNVAAIHYYFGDKASLYREVFRIPEQLGQWPAQLADPTAPLRDAMVALFRHIMAYIVAPQQVQQLRLVLLREELQPSGVLNGQLDGPQRLHDQMLVLLCRAVGIDAPDTALHHLAFSIGGLALVLFVQRTAVDQIAPELLATEAALEATIQRMADHGVVLVEAEALRRGTRVRRSNERAESSTVAPTHLRAAPRRLERS